MLLRSATRCEELADLVALSDDREMDPRERFALVQHAAACPRCREEMARLAQVPHLLARGLRPMPLAAPQPRVEAAPRPAAARPRPAASPWPALPRPLLVAAAVVLAVALFVLRNLDGPPGAEAAALQFLDRADKALLAGVGPGQVLHVVARDTLRDPDGIVTWQSWTEPARDGKVFRSYWVKRDQAGKVVLQQWRVGENMITLGPGWQPGIGTCADCPFSWAGRDVSSEIEGLRRDLEARHVAAITRDEERDGDRRVERLSVERTGAGVRSRAVLMADGRTGALVGYTLAVETGSGGWQPVVRERYQNSIVGLGQAPPEFRGPIPLDQSPWQGGGTPPSQGATLEELRAMGLPLYLPEDPDVEFRGAQTTGVLSGATLLRLFYWDLLADRAVNLLEGPERILLPARPLPPSSAGPQELPASRPVDIGGTQAWYSDNTVIPETGAIYWQVDSTYITLYGRLPPERLLEIARSVRPDLSGRPDTSGR